MQKYMRRRRAAEKGIVQEKEVTLKIDVTGLTQDEINDILATIERFKADNEVKNETNKQ